MLTRADVQGLFVQEAAARRVAAAELAALGRTDAADALTAEAAIVDGYCD